MDLPYSCRAGEWQRARETQEWADREGLLHTLIGLRVLRDFILGNWAVIRALLPLHPAGSADHETAARVGVSL